MKKIVGIIAALALAGSVFARPDITPVITSFTGNAKVEWIANLDAETYGFENSTWVEWKVQTKSADWGGESTSGDGWWGELNIRTGADYVAEQAKGGSAYYGWALPDVTVEVAKIHFIDGDTYLNVDIKAPDFGVPIVDLSFAFGDNGEKIADEKEWAFKINAALKPIDGLTLSAGFAMDTAAKDNWAIGASAAYKFAIDDKFYIAPFLNFTKVGEAMAFNAAAIFGWGGSAHEWDHDFYNFKNDELNAAKNNWRTADGFSVMFKKGLKDAAGNTIDTSSLDIAFYDGALFAGLSDALAGLKLAARYSADDVAELGDGCFDFGLIYSGTFGIVYVDTKASFGINLALDENNTAAKYYIQVGTKEVIANTDLYIKYAGSISEYVGTAGAEDNFKKGTITLGTQINF